MNTRRIFTNTVNPVVNHLISASLLLLLGLSVGVNVKAQDPDGQSPSRGFTSTGSYALSDIESISLNGGNMTYVLPLASLPPSRGGKLKPSALLVYNSKLYDTKVTIASGTFNYTQTDVVKAGSGGWRYGVRYLLETTNRATNYLNGAPPPWDTHKYQSFILFPDGSRHPIKPIGHVPATDLSSGEDYYDVHTSTVPMTWYSTDGTYCRVSVNAGGWTINFPDGSTVTDDANTDVQTTTDSNGNSFTVQNITLPNGNLATRVADQLDRTITIEYTTNSIDYVRVNGFGGTELVTTVNWGTSSPQGKRYLWRVYTDPLETYKNLVAIHPSVVSITLPNSLSYQFLYNSDVFDPNDPTKSVGWGELYKTILPTGAYVQYAYAMNNHHDEAQSVEPRDILRNRPTAKRLNYTESYDGGNQNRTDTWSYGMTYQFPGEVISGSVTNPDGGNTTDHFYDHTAPAWQQGLSYKTVIAGGTVVEKIWNTNVPFGGNGKEKNAYVKTKFTSVKNAAGVLVKTAIKDFNIDKNGNLLQLIEYDWVNYGDVPRDVSGKPTGIPGSAQIKRVTVNDYYNATPQASDTSYNQYTYHIAPINFLKALQSSEVRSGITDTTALSRMELSYDEVSTRGNVEEQKSWDSTKAGISRPLTDGNSVSVTHQYDPYGNRIWTTDARSVQTQFIYDPINGHNNLYVTQTKVAAGTSVQRWTTLAYDFNTGLVTEFTDMDNNVTGQTAYDVFGRPTIVKEAVGTANERWTRTEYDDQARRVVVRAALDATDDQKLATVRHYDQLGRICLTRRLENPSDDVTNETLGIKVQMRYYAGDMNNPDPAYQSAYQAVSNPYRAATSSAAAGGENGFTMGWVRTKFDKGKRVIEAQTFGADLPQPWGAGSTGTGVVITEYDGEIITVTDQAGKKRRSQTDALGRLVKVTEDPGGLNYDTTYLYEPLDNLRYVQQGTQGRWFSYDSLSRLIRVRNPEQNCNPNLPPHTDPFTGGSCWSMAYSYDPNGNLTQRIDARGVVTTYTYDALNRNTVTDYVNGSQTRSVEKFYDGVANGKGRLHYERTKEGGVNSTEMKIDSYDALGRPLNKQHSFWRGSDWGNPFVIQQTYNLAGAIKTLTYPSDRTVTYSYDQAGQLNSFTGNLGDGVNRNYAIGIQYDAAGSMKREQFGTTIPIYHRRHHNDRGQLFDIRLGTDPNLSYDTDDLGAWQNAAGSWNRGALKLYYSAIDGCYLYGNGGTDNNGNLLRMDHQIPLDDAVSNFVTSIDRYDYDPLNRLQSVTEIAKGPAGENDYHGIFRQAFIYDPWGNRTIDQINTTGAVNKKAYTVDTSTNRLQPPAGSGTMQYDAAGNLEIDPYTNEVSQRFVYDGENRLLEAYNDEVRVSWYVYNAEGMRVVRTVGSQGTWQIYGCGGELLAEYAIGAAPTAPQKEYGYRNGQLLVMWDGGEAGDRQLQWLVKDHLGSTRMVVDRSGSLAGITRHDYAPFGEELSAGVGIRSASNGYSVDSVRQKFGSYERDNETELDFAQSRYYGSVQGRFTSPDSFFGRKTNPQTLNLYAYVLNNPLKWTDPTGHFTQDPEKKDFINLGEIGHVEIADKLPEKKPGLFSRIWGGLKKIGSAIGGAVKNAANDFRERDKHVPFPFFTPIDPNATPKVLLAGIPEFEVIAASEAEAGVVAEGATIVEDVLAESEIFFRTMSQEHYDTLQATGNLPATSETFISPSVGYASQYNGVTVQFNVQAGTTNSLLGIGVRNAGLNGGAYNSLPLVQRGWVSNNAFFKLEGNVVNIGLGRGSALNIFNNNIVNFNRVPKP